MFINLKMSIILKFMNKINILKNKNKEAKIVISFSYYLAIEFLKILRFRVLIMILIKLIN